MQLQGENWEKLFSGPTEPKVCRHPISDCGEERKEEVSRQEKPSKIRGPQNDGHLLAGLI